MQYETDFYTNVRNRSIERAAIAEIKSDLITLVENYIVDETINNSGVPKSQLEIEFNNFQREFFGRLKPILISVIKNQF